MSDRQTLRRQLRQARRALNRDRQRQAARSLFRQLRRYPPYLKAKRIAFYLANDGEIDLDIALRQAKARGKTCYLPKLARNGHLLFAPIIDGRGFSRNRFGIPEPDCGGLRLVSARRLDLILMPLVGFDRNGNRLGMGGGYYDRSLAFKRHSAASIRPRLVGVAHDFQHLDSLQPQPWDVPLDVVITDAGRYCPGSRRC